MQNNQIKNTQYKVFIVQGCCPPEYNIVGLGGGYSCYAIILFWFLRAGYKNSESKAKLLLLKNRLCKLGENKRYILKRYWELGEKYTVLVETSLQGVHTGRLKKTLHFGFQDLKGFIHTFQKM